MWTEIQKQIFSYIPYNIEILAEVTNNFDGTYYTTFPLNFENFDWFFLSKLEPEIISAQLMLTTDMKQPDSDFINSQNHQIHSDCTGLDTTNLLIYISDLEYYPRCDYELDYMAIERIIDKYKSIKFDLYDLIKSKHAIDIDTAKTLLTN